MIVGLGGILIASTILYLIPKTSILGAILLTGYLGGAMATQRQNGRGLVSDFVSGSFGVLLWVGLWLRDDRLQKLIPLRD